MAVEVSGRSVYQADSRDGPWSSELTRVAVGLTRYFRDPLGVSHEVVGFAFGGTVNDERLEKGKVAVAGFDPREVNMNPDPLDMFLAIIYFQGT